MKKNLIFLFIMFMCFWTGLIFSQSYKEKAYYYYYGAQADFSPVQIDGLVFWYDCSVTSSITQSGGLVSQWDDLSGNGHHLTSSLTLRPDYSVDGIVFGGGTDYNDQLKAAPFTLTQPITIFYVATPKSWIGSYMYFFDGDGVGTMGLTQISSTPNICLRAGNNTTANGNFTIDETAIVTAFFNGASSSLQINNTTATTGNCGSNNAGGFTLGNIATGGSGAYAIVKEVLGYVGLNAAEILIIKTYLSKRWIGSL